MFFSCSIPRFKQRFSVMIALPGGLSSTLDAVKVADTTLFLASACQQNGIDAVGEKILIACLAHGLPSTVVAVVDLDSLPLAVRISLIHPTNQ
jgi:pre-rRNA-processing protein TSR1